MAKRYHMLFTRTNRDGTWAPQFGDFDRNTVVEESKYTYNDVPKADIVIMPLPNARKEHCDNAVRALNRYGKNIRLS